MTGDAAVIRMCREVGFIVAVARGSRSGQVSCGVVDPTRFGLFKVKDTGNLDRWAFGTSCGTAG
jgi:hypothetical protein